MRVERFKNCLPSRAFISEPVKARDRLSLPLKGLGGVAGKVPAMRIAVHAFGWYRAVATALEKAAEE